MIDTLQGHWRRAWIKAPGFADHSTRVHWMQAGDIFADVRVPDARPDLTGTASLSALPNDALLSLMQAEGFAGHVTLDGTTCTWHREVNWHGPATVPDAGDISFDAEGRMIEAGVHADYTELWEQTAAGTTRAWRLSGDGVQGVLVADLSRFVLGIGPPEAAPFSPLIEALSRGVRPAALAQVWQSLYATGVWEGGTAVATLATQPFCEGAVVLEMADTKAVWHQIAFDGAAQPVALRAEAAA